MNFGVNNNIIFVCGNNVLFMWKFLFFKFKLNAFVDFLRETFKEDNFWGLSPKVALVIICIEMIQKHGYFCCVFWEIEKERERKRQRENRDRERESVRTKRKSEKKTEIERAKREEEWKEEKGREMGEQIVGKKKREREKEKDR